MKNQAREVDAYIAAAPKEARPVLRQLRLIIKSCVPEATEKLSYRMPYYSHHGRLAYFAAHTHHVSLYALGRAMERYAEEVRPYRTSSATLRFPHGTKLPVALLRKLITARAKENEAAKKK